MSNEKRLRVSCNVHFGECDNGLMTVKSRSVETLDDGLEFIRTVCQDAVMETDFYAVTARILPVRVDALFGRAVM